MSQNKTSKLPIVMVCVLDGERTAVVQQPGSCRHGQKLLHHLPIRGNTNDVTKKILRDATHVSLASHSDGKVPLSSELLRLTLLPGVFLQGRGFAICDRIAVGGRRDVILDMRPSPFVASSPNKIEKVGYINPVFPFQMFRENHEIHT